MKKIISIIILGLLVGCSFGVQGIFFKDSSEERTNIGVGDFFFNQKMEIMMKLAKCPSQSACVIRDNKVIWAKGYGYYDLDNKKLATENTIYNIGSTTKTITGTALMQLWEQGLFDLDEDVNNYLPFSLRNPRFPDEPITFRMLLTHSSTLRDDIPFNDAFGISLTYNWLNISGDPPFSFFPQPWLEDHLTPDGKSYNPAHWAERYKPGATSWYAQINYAVVAYLVELISGEIFVDYCKEHIFLPLEMYHTSFNLSELDIDNVAIPYFYHTNVNDYVKINELSIDGIIPQVKYWKILNYPAGGLYSTVTDLSHFFIAHMNNGVWNGIRILEDETVDEMHKIQPPGNFNTMIQAYCGLAWCTREKPYIFNITISGYIGLNIGLNTAMLYIPGEKIGVIKLTNGDYFNGVTLINDLILIQLFRKGGLNLISFIDFSNN